MKTGIVVQARTGSTRFPRKVLRPFHGEAAILDLLLGRLCANGLGLPCLLATTTQATDDDVARCGERHGVDVFRGPEDDVLARFLGAADAFGLDAVVRVCADNPFLDLPLLEALVEHAAGARCDYASHAVAGKPAMLTHFGLFAEYVTADALRRTDARTREPRYREHVTNFIYTHPDLFDVAFLEAPAVLEAYPDARLTVDTAEDFETARRLFTRLAETGRPVEAAAILALLADSPALRARMRRQIALQPK